MVLTDQELQEIAKKFPDIAGSLDQLIGQPSMFNPFNKFDERSRMGLKLSEAVLAFAHEVARVAASK